jgi:hypothetical protein
MTLNAFRRAVALLLPLLPMMCACSRHAPDPDTPRQLEAGRREGEAMQSALATLPPECTLGAPGVGAPGVRAPSQELRRNWLTASETAAEPGNSYVWIFTFDTPATTRALHVALNPQGLRDLEKVETRNARGEWNEAGPIARHDAPAACEFVWLEQELSGARQVEALRLTFRQGPGTIKVANADRLQDSASQPGT